MQLPQVPKGQEGWQGRQERRRYIYIHIVDLLLTSAGNTSWIFDTGFVAHISNSIQGLRNRRRLTKDEVTTRVGNDSQVEVVAVDTMHLSLPSGLVLILNKCFYVPALSVNIVRGSYLKQDHYYS